MSRELIHYDHGGGLGRPHDAGGPSGQRRREPEEAGFKDLWNALWRRKWVMISTVGVLTGLAVVYVQTATPMYSAESLVRIGGEESVAIPLPAEIGGGFVADTATIESEIALLKSYQFSASVVDELELIEDPEFNSALTEEGGLAENQSWMPAFLSDWLYGSAGEELDRAVAGAIDARDVERNVVVNAFRSNLGVSQVGRSKVLEISYLSADANKAAMIVNAVADLYIEKQIERKYETTRRAAEWLQARVDEMRDQVIDAENRIVEARTASGRVGDGEFDQITAELSNLNFRLAEAQSARAQAEARYSPVAGQSPERAAQVLTSPLMENLRGQETEISRRLSELETIYGDQHPQIVNVRAELASIQARMNAEAQRIMVDLRNEVQVARAAERELQARASQLQAQLADRGGSSVAIADLEREAESNRELYEQFRSRLQTLEELIDVQQADAVILSRADPPVLPAFPNKKLIVALAAFCAAGLGLMLIFVIERWGKSTGFRSSSEILEELGIKALAMVPDLGKRELQGVPTPEEYILQKPHSAFAEALQRVRTALFMNDVGAPVRTVMITSSVPVEGKTLISQALARQSARSGLRTLLIDADLRRPRLHEVVRVANHGGLSDVVLGKLTLADAVRLDEKSGCHFLPAGVGAGSPPDMFRSEAMRELLAEASAHYDLVVLDSPPVGAVSDSCILGQITDRTLYVVRWEQTPRELVAHGLQQLAEAGAYLAGVVVSRVDMKKQAQYGYGEAGQYHGYYKKYYVD